MYYTIMNGSHAIFTFESEERAVQELTALRAPPDGPRREAGKRCTIVTSDTPPPYPPPGGFRADGTPYPFELDSATGYAKPSSAFK